MSDDNTIRIDSTNAKRFIETCDAILAGSELAPAPCSADIDYVIQTADGFGNLMPSLLWTPASDEATKAGLVEDVPTAYGKWQRLTAIGMRRKFTSPPNGPDLPGADQASAPSNCCAADHMAFLRTLPMQVMVNWISDASKDEIGITLSTFALGMQPRFKNTTPLEMFDLCAAVIREHVARRQNDVAHPQPRK